MLKWQQKRRPSIIALAVDEDAKKHMSDEVRKSVLNDDFWDGCDDLLDTLEPLANGIDRMQSDKEPASIVFHVFTEWEDLFDAEQDDDEDKEEDEEEEDEGERGDPNAADIGDDGDEDHKEPQQEQPLLVVRRKRLAKKKKNVVDKDPMDDFILKSVRNRWDLISDIVHAAAYSVDARFRNHDMGIAYLDEAEDYFKCCVFLSLNLSC